MSTLNSNTTLALIPSGDNHFQLQGKLLFGTIEPFYQEAENALMDCSDNISHHVIIDFSGVIDVDSAGVALLVCWTRLLHHAGKKVRIVNPSKQLLSLMELSHLNGILAVANMKDH